MLRGTLAAGTTDRLLLRSLLHARHQLSLPDAFAKLRGKKLLAGSCALHVMQHSSLITLAPVPEQCCICVQNQKSQSTSEH